METFFTVIHPLFEGRKWRLDKKDNTVCYKKACDEFMITMLPKTKELEITIPLRDAVYKNKFYNPTDALEYVKMHLDRF